MKRKFSGLLASAGFAALLLVSAQALAQLAPNLGVAGQFGALGNSGVTGSAGAGTVVQGDVGSGPTTPTIINFTDTGGPSSVTPPFVIHSAANAITAQANSDANAAYTFLAGQGLGTALGNNLSIVGPLLPGIYSSGAADLGASTDLVLNDPSPGNTGIFVFNITTAMTMNNLSRVIGTASPCNVYWRVASDVTLNGTTFMGTVIADRSITVSSASNVQGRLLAGAITGTGVVTMAVGGNTIGGCSLAAPLVLGPVAPTVSKSFAPVSINAGATSTLTVTLFNTSSDTVDTITTLTDNLPAGVVIAAVPNALTTCVGGVVAAPAGGGTVTLTGGVIPVANLVTSTPGTCIVTVNVTSAVAGPHINTVLANGLVTNNGNNAAPASATLTVLALVNANIPTLSEWGMIILASLLALFGFAAVRRQAS